MKASIRLSVAAVATVASFAAPAALAADAGKPITLVEAMDLVANTFPGQVIAGQTDTVGGDRMHHHVDFMLPNGSVARFDVDAADQRIFNRQPPEPSPASVSIEQAVRKVEQSKGRVVAVEFDPSPTPHYHMTVLARGGKASRLDVDVHTGEIKPHAPRT
ncbi:MAG TPA: PepSY domain-containing protein [Usitatibacter sp.]|nr:PepSY domain-containing protein [Usitatibacter sp.]